MADGYYVSGPERSSRVAALFSSIAPRYDLLNDLQSFGLHRLWKRRLARLAACRSTDRVLDVCCGTGDVARLMSRGGARVAGVDFNLDMLGQACSKARNGEVKEGRIEWCCGDATRLPFRDGVFDIATMSYGLRNLASERLGIEELIRVLRPGGRLLILDFGKPKNRLWRMIYFFYLRMAVPVMGRLFAGDRGAYAYILESLEAYGAQEGVLAELRAAGCRDAVCYNLLGGIMSIHSAGKRGVTI